MPGTLQGNNVEAQGDTAADDQTLSLPKWNQPRINAYRFLTTILCFIIMGMNDASVGALLPYIGEYYNVSYTVISLVFLAPFVGYVLAALSNNLIHHYMGQRGVAILGPLTRLIGYVPLCLHPPFAALPPIMLFPGFGNGIEDSAWNAWIGNMESANELLGFIHGGYGLGATIAPLIATAMVTKANLPWYTFYYLMVGMASLELCLTTTTFWRATRTAYRQQHAVVNGGVRTTTRMAMKHPITWIVALFLLGYVGAEVSLGGWIVSFMLRVRDAEPFQAGLTVTFFWLGLTMGRLILGFVTGRVGEKLAITFYLLISIALHLMYWLIPNFIASSVFVALEGFFIGPFFPAAIVAATKLLPSDYHVSAIGFAAAFGGGGAAVFPFAVGAIAETKGVEVLQPIVLAIFLFISLMWFALPGGMRRGGLERARDTNENVGHQVAMGYRWLKQRSDRKQVTEIDQSAS
ncbi:major facilitator superfamily domain-containing protein [Pseudomassariella vexata]|uniref:Major facilitator superfamily domain-containing protein n=1 Tax=Pseudomassariella vexata TaxID=1141098 RepID=A0A1Y2DYB8_9PEZI|nr:major facilitator superfamily domain-containing protein [Pseudomassariella vexata]ORY64261.1 major facilitator superfamily domain-containing protein [Pseudomassariella vexata]